MLSNHLYEPKTMLRITTEKKRGKLILGVEGRLAGPSVLTLERCWRELRTATPGEKLSVNLCGVSFIDLAGKMLLKEIYRQGGQLVAEGCLNQEIVREIVGNAEGKGRSDHDSRGRRSHILFYGFLFGSLLVPAGLRAQQPASAPAERRDASGVLRLTLDQAVALALKLNPTAQIAVH